MYGWDLDDYTCTLKCMCLLDYIQCQLSMRISAKESRTRVACLDSCCHGLGLVDIDEITFLSKLVYPSMRILNLGKKEKRKSPQPPKAHICRKRFSGCPHCETSTSLQNQTHDNQHRRGYNEAGSDIELAPTVSPLSCSETHPNSGGPSWFP